ncbi:MAG: DUF2849 domain-containing protein [Roseovarius sp.]|nr:DUF2849 domain-containing protein [Roseovarius sp.]
MTGKFTPKVVTANALREGDVVYMKANDDWTRDLGEAELLTEEGYAKLRLLMAEGQPEYVVGPYLADVADGENGPRPIHFREAFRSAGPSNYFHGKQAGLN